MEVSDQWGSLSSHPVVKSFPWRIETMVTGIPRVTTPQVPLLVLVLEWSLQVDAASGTTDGLVWDSYAKHGDHGAGIQNPTELGDFLWVSTLVCIFQHHGEHLGMFSISTYWGTQF